MHKVDHRFVWNSASFSSATDANAIPLLRDALAGLIEIPGEGETASLYFSEADILLNRRISPGKSVQDFLDHLSANNDVDLYSAFMEIQDKADAIAELDDVAFLALAENAFYFTDLGYSGSEDFLTLAVHLDAVLFGVQSSEFWQDRELKYSIYPAPENNAQPLIIFSVASLLHGQALKKEHLESLETIGLSSLLPNCWISDYLIKWFEGISEENKAIVRRKLSLAHGRGFQGGKPLFETLNDADGMREVRFNAISGGAIRILFGSIPDGKQALFVGWIKKSKGDGYVENIQIASELWASLKAK
jgi:hypothetical protein